ncbi:MFS transporter [Diaminobutyricimonas sp. TR449]|uniref:MFS transporter n=1 Tax=Diaminobutyricimonas sp. TR449 TaxID=2708076 RepID=UPI00142452B8|nr:MFS transporter [Diaminobutyricimonas sp. TR449]
MTTARARPLWAGRTLALLAIALLALNMRTAVTSVSPIVEQISVDIPLGSVALGVLGMLPAIMFALAGLFSPGLARRIGLEATLVVACVLIVAGFLVRAAATEYSMFLVSSAVALVAMGIGNVLLPAAVKRYFPDRIGLLTSVYVTLLAISTTIPAAISAPVADAASWRVSMLVWAGLGLTALVPWMAVLVQHRRSLVATAAEEAPEVEVPGKELLARLLRSRTAWALAMSMGTSSLSAYTMFAWLPPMLTDWAGLSQGAAGGLLSVYALVGLPLGLLFPFLTQRAKNGAWLVLIGAAQLAISYTGLLLVPALAPLWVVLAGGPILFPVTLTLINLRTRDHVVTAATSGFAQGIGYTVAGLGPLLFGVLFEVSGDWALPLVFLLCTSLGAFVAGILLLKNRMVDDELVR